MLFNLDLHFFPLMTFIVVLNTQNVEYKVEITKTYHLK
jgi:hypothetical protein